MSTKRARPFIPWWTVQQDRSHGFLIVTTWLQMTNWWFEMDLLNEAGVLCTYFQCLQCWVMDVRWKTYGSHGSGRSVLCLTSVDGTPSSVSPSVKGQVFWNKIKGRYITYRLHFQLHPMTTITLEEENCIKFCSSRCHWTAPSELAKVIFYLLIVCFSDCSV